MSYSKLSKRQFLILLSNVVAQFFNAACVSLQAPFFPQEAEKKGATATEYGCVFGVFQLVVFLISPWYGKYVGSIGPDMMFFCGITTAGVSSILFGFLDLINGHLLFISLAFFIRIIEALGSAALITAGFAIISHEFSDNIATTFALMETFYGLGLIVGPTMGGVLYQLGGFSAPFITVGMSLFICAALTKFILPSLSEYQSTGPNADKVWQIFRIKGMLLCTCGIMTTTICISFISVTLEPHIRQFNLTPIQVGFVFIVNGGVYAVTAPAWGWLCDSKCVRLRAITVFGGIILVFGIIFIGPAPFAPLRKSLLLIILGLVLHGLGVGARLVSLFIDALQIAVDAGMPNAIETNGIISALLTSSLAFGSFVGPTFSGFLYDHYGFANASLFIIVLMAIMIILEFWSLIETRRKKSDSSEYESLEPTDIVTTANLSTIKNTSAFIETYTVGISSNRVLNLVHCPDPNLKVESAPILQKN